MHQLLAAVSPIQNFKRFCSVLLCVMISIILIILKTPILLSFSAPLVTKFFSNDSVTMYVRVKPNENFVRQALRNTWVGEAKELGIKTYFIVGLPENLTDLPKLELEATKYNDILIFKTFTDRYHVMTQKTREMFRWHLKYSDTNFVFLSNSDAIVYPKNLLKFISTEVTLDDAVYGSCTCNGDCIKTGLEAAPYRNPNFKWHMPASVWPAPTIPHYCHGHGVLLSYNTIEKLMIISDNTSETFINDFWIDDVLYGGIFRAEAGIPLRSFDDYFFYDIKGLKCLIKEMPCIALHLHGIWNDEEKIRFYRNRLNEAKHYAEIHKTEVIDIETWNKLLNMSSADRNAGFLRNKL